MPQVLLLTGGAVVGVTTLAALLRQRQSLKILKEHLEHCEARCHRLSELAEKYHRELLQCRSARSFVGVLFTVGPDGKVRMSLNLKKSQSATVTATFIDNTVDPPVQRPLGSLPTFADPAGKLKLTPDPASTPNDSVFNCKVEWGDTSAAGDVSTITCHAEGDPTPGVDPIDCPPFGISLLADEDNAGTLTGVIN